MELILIVPIILSFFITFFAVPSWIKRASRAGLSGEDMNKKEKPKIAEAGGVVVIMGFIIGVWVYAAIKTFYFKSSEDLIEIYALTSSIVLIAFVGMIDDVLGWKIGLNKKTRMLLVLIAAVPLIVMNAGHSRIGIPFNGNINIGLLYPLLIIPLGIVGASTTYNFLAGYNGLEAGQGILIIGALSLVAFFTGNSWLSLIGMCMIVSLFAFLWFNKFPAKVFPGDSLTYSIGALIAIFAILGNFERIAIFFFIPYILEVGLKLRGNLEKESFAKLGEEGSLELPYKKIYGLEHLAIKALKKIKGKVFEEDVVVAIHIFQFLIIIVGFIIFRNFIF